MATKSISSAHMTSNPKRLVTSLNFITNKFDDPGQFLMRENLVYKLLDQPELIPKLYSLYSGSVGEV